MSRKGRKGCLQEAFFCLASPSLPESNSPPFALCPKVLSFLEETSCAPLLTTPVLLKELHEMKKLEQTLSTNIDIAFIKPTLCLAHATVNEGILVSLLEDADLSETERSKKVEQCINKLEVEQAGLGDIKSMLHPEILAQSTRSIVSIGR